MDERSPASDASGAGQAIRRKAATARVSGMALRNDEPVTPRFRRFRWMWRVRCRSIRDLDTTFVFQQVLLGTHSIAENQS